MLGVGFGLVLALLLFAISMGLYNARETRDIAPILKVSNEKAHHVSEAREALTVMLSSMPRLLLFKDDKSMQQEELAKIQAARTAYEEALDKVDKSEKSEDGRKIIDNVKKAAQDAKRADDSVIDSITADKAPDAATLYANSSVPLSEKASESLRELARYEEGQRSMLEQKTEGISRNALTLMIAFSVMAAMTLIALGFFIMRGVARPLLEALRGMKRLSGGNLTAISAGASRGEVGQLFSSMNGMAANLRDLVRNTVRSSYHVAVIAEKVSGGSDRITKSAQEEAVATEQATSSVEQMVFSMAQVARNTESLAANVDETSSTISQMAASLDQVGKSVSNMAESVDQTAVTIETMLASLEMTAGSAGSMMSAVGETSSTVGNLLLSIEQVSRAAESLRTIVVETSGTFEEMTATVREVAERISGADIISQTAFSEAEEGGKAIYQSIESLENIGKSAEKTMAAIRQLGKRSEDIGSVVEVIDEIADQTNLLALNAAIEAARAGDAGRGFGVVADEIRRLAERSMGATKEISVAIKQIQEETRVAIRATEETYREGKGGRTLAENSRDAFTAIIASMKDSSEVIRGISRSASELNDAIGRTMKYVTDMSSATEHVASAAGEQVGSAGNIRSALDKMNRMVSEVSLSVNEQSTGGRLIRRAVGQMNGLVREVRVAVGEQVEGVGQIVRSVETMHAMTRGVAGATAEQRAGGETIVKAMEGLGRISSENLRLSKDMMSMAGDCLFQAETLQYSISAFRIDSNGKRCWEIMNCPETSRRECPAYMSEEDRCWLISGTWCKGAQQGDSKDKLRRCVTCEAFKVIQGVSV